MSYVKQTNYRCGHYRTERVNYSQLGGIKRKPVDCPKCAGKRKKGKKPPPFRIGVSLLRFIWACKRSRVAWEKAHGKHSVPLTKHNLLKYLRVKLANEDYADPHYGDIIFLANALCLNLAREIIPWPTKITKSKVVAVNWFFRVMIKAKKQNMLNDLIPSLKHWRIRP